MTALRNYISLIGLLLTFFGTCSAQDEIEKPTFPDVFQVEVEGNFLFELAEMSGSIYYDKTNNRTALSYIYRGEYAKTIYNFNENEMISIQGNNCSTSDIGVDAGESFFPFGVDKNNKMVLAKPEEIFFFTNSKLDRQDLFVYPAYIYKGVLNLPQYGREDCNVMHVFSNPDVELPNCDSHICKPTLVTISIQCPKNSDEDEEVNLSYNFYRFKSSISDPSMFQLPVGVYCDKTNPKVFPGMPGYFSFSYDLVVKQVYSDDDSGVFPMHKKVWYDSKLSIIRMDEFDDDGLLTSSKIFDFYGAVAYTIVSSLAICEEGSINEKVALEEMTELPKIFFLKSPTKKDALYIGSRNIHTLDYEVWSLSSTNLQNEATVEEYYFIKTNSQDIMKLQISHVDIFTYQRNDETKLVELSTLTHLTINNFQSKPKQWSDFDVSSCYGKEHKLGFRLKLKGPPLVKDSPTYRQVLEQMYMKLIIATKVSIIRISELTGTFDGIDISDFTGWILDKSATSSQEEIEPEMNAAYGLLEKAATSGKLSIKLKKNSEDIQYLVTAIERISENSSKKSQKDCFSGGSMAAASLVLLIIGISFGIAGYYVFLKKKKSHREDKVNLTSLN